MLPRLAMVSLETFLGGMETGQGLRHRRRIGSLKPSLVEWKLAESAALNASRRRLETFLGGMETPLPKESGGQVMALKPSLVEWKLLEVMKRGEAAMSLKPSLVEWKHLLRLAGLDNEVVP